MAGGPPEWPLKILQQGVATTYGSPLSLSGDLFFTLAGSWPLPSSQEAGSEEATNPVGFAFIKQTDTQQSPTLPTVWTLFYFKKGFLATYAKWTGVVILSVENHMVQETKAGSERAPVIIVFLFGFGFS